MSARVFGTKKEGILGVKGEGMDRKKERESQSKGMELNLP